MARDGDYWIDRLRHDRRHRGAPCGVAEFLDVIGYDTLDAGHDRPVSRDELSAQLAQATRYRDQ